MARTTWTWMAALLLSSLALRACAAEPASEPAAKPRVPPKDLRIGVLHRPETCTHQIERGDRIEVHCTCARRRTARGGGARAGNEGMNQGGLRGKRARGTGPRGARTDTGSFFDDNRQFASSYERNKPIEFTVGVNQIVEGTRRALWGAAAAGLPRPLTWAGGASGRGCTGTLVRRDRVGSRCYRNVRGREAPARGSSVPWYERPSQRAAGRAGGMGTGRPTVWPC